MSISSVKNCVLCGASVLPEIGDYVTFVNSIRVVVPNIPSGRCQGCGHVFVHHENSAEIQAEAEKYYDKAFVLENRLKKVRENLGLSMEEVALRMGFSKSRYEQIENSKKAPGIYIALRLAHVLGCDVNDLFQLKIAVRPEKRSLRSGKGVSVVKE